VSREPVEAMKALLGKAHADKHAHVRIGHATGVSELVDQVLTESGECPDPVLQGELAAAALGHDLYEDTTIDRDHVKRLGARVDLVIDGLTVRDRSQPAPVLDRNLIEAARLIKIADLVENTVAVTRDLPRLGTDWARKRFVPTLTSVGQTVQAAGFSRYPASADRLRQRLAAASKDLATRIAAERDRELATPPVQSFAPLAGNPDVLAAEEESQLRSGWLVQGMHVFREKT
jgi:hypothetical protein